MLVNCLGRRYRAVKLAERYEQLSTESHNHLIFVSVLMRSYMKAGVRTLSVRLGTKKVFWMCITFLEVAYFGAIVTGLMSNVSPMKLPRA